MKRKKRVIMMGMMLVLIIPSIVVRSQTPCTCKDSTFKLDVSTQKVVDRLVMYGTPSLKNDTLEISFLSPTNEQCWFWLIKDTTKVKKDTSCLGQLYILYKKYAKVKKFSRSLCSSDIQETIITIQKMGKYEENHTITHENDDYIKILNVQEKFFTSPEGEKYMKNALKQNKKLRKQREKLEKK